jgi:hypothetical protein
MKMAAFWDIEPCSLIGAYWTQYASLKNRSASARLHGAIFQKTAFRFLDTCQCCGETSVSIFRANVVDVGRLSCDVLLACRRISTFGETYCLQLQPGIWKWGWDQFTWRPKLYVRTGTGWRWQRRTKFGGGVWWMPYAPNRSYRKHWLIDVSPIR